LIHLYNGLRPPEAKETRWFANRSARSELNHAIHTHFVNCPNCGGLIPELEIQDKERTFRFACTQIIENGKTLAQTDYTNLLFHLLADELATNKHLTKKDLDSPLRDFARRLIKKTEKKG
jgi:hypothetical protein